jgi:endonuclease/exonuclease/phosphatase family metal-dependent hydrolase
MRLLVYNIRYATGTGAAFHLPLPGAGYLRANRQALEDITQFIKGEDPDIVGLIEVDTGSVRSGMINQAEHIGAALGHYSIYECKYGLESIPAMMPIVRKQSNALLAAPRVHGQRFHYFESGIKRLIIELELEHAVVFLVHLSLKYRHRQEQLRSLHDLVVEAGKPAIVAGDFNTFFGEDEMFLFMKATGLRSANAARAATYPSDSPRHELDFILYSPGIEVTSFKVPSVEYSDHRPLVCDFTVHGRPD